MKTVQVLPAAKSYGAFEMKEFIGKSTLRSFGMTMGLMILIPLVCLVMKASVTPIAPIVPLGPKPIPVKIQSEEKREVPRKIIRDLPSAAPDKISGKPIPVIDEMVDEKAEVDFTKIQEHVVVNGGKEVDGTVTTENDQLGEAKTLILPDEEEVFVETESDPILNYAQLQANLIYPEMAKRIDIEGKVLIRVVVGKDGKPVQGKVRVLESSNELFNQAAIDAVMKSSFTPAIQNKQPIEVPVTVPIVFRLR